MWCLFPLPDTQLLELLESLNWCFFCCVNELTGGLGSRESQDWSWLPGKPIKWLLAGWNFSPTPGRREVRIEELDIESIITGRWFNQSCLSNEAFIKILKVWGWESFQVADHTEVVGKVALLEKAWKLPAPSLILHPMHLFHWLFLSYSLQ